MKTAIIDGDAIRHPVASKGEKRTVHIVHKQSGDEYNVNTRTEFYGHWKKKEGGLLAEINKSSDSPIQADEFTYTDVQTPEPVSNVLHTCKLYTENLIKAASADDFKIYVGKGKVWRVEHSTILEYKGNRAESIRPLHMDEVTNYLCRKFGAEVVEHYEVDEILVMDCYKRKDRFAVANEKDAYYCPMQLFDTSKPSLGIQNCDQYGKLWKDAKGKVRGIGRLWMYQLICSNDSADNYYANSATDMKWGEKSSFDILSKCSNDKDAWEAMYGIYKILYPEPKVVTGWRGDSIEVDAAYMLQENFTMCHMMRFKDDFPNVKEIMDKMGIIY